MRIAPSNRMVSPLSIGFATMWATSAAYSLGSPNLAGCGICASSDARAWSESPRRIGAVSYTHLTLPTILRV